MYRYVQIVNIIFKKKIFGHIFKYSFGNLTCNMQWSNKYEKCGSKKNLKNNV